MSDKSIPSRQSQSKHKIYYFKTGVLAPAGQGAAPSNPYKEGTVRLRPYEDEEKEPMGKYLSADDQRLLVDYGERTQKGEFGIDAKYMYVDLAERLETSKDEAVDVKEILKLLGVIDLKGNDSDYNIRIALKEAFPESKVIKNLYPEMKKAQTKSKSSSMNDPPEIDNTDVPPNQPIIAKKTSFEQSIDKVRDIQKGLRVSAENRTERERVSAERKASRSASREKDISRPTDPDFMNTIDPNVYEYRDASDPTDSTKMMDSGGANIDLLGESLGQSRRTPSAPPDNRYLDSDVPQDLQNQQAIDYNTTIGSNPYDVVDRQMAEYEERERRAMEQQWAGYTKETELLAKDQPNYGGTDMTGVGKGGRDDMKHMEEQTAPAEVNALKPETMKGQPRQPSQARDGTIDPAMGGVPLTDYDVRRTPQNSGSNTYGMTVAQERDFLERLTGAGDDRFGVKRLVDRATMTSLLDTANSAMSAGSGMMAQITDFLDLQH
jgi:hypothetical protein